MSAMPLQHQCNFVEYMFGKHDFKKHFHTSYSIGLILNGVHKVDINGEDIVAKTGSIKIINPYEIHIADGTLSWKYANFMPNENLIKNIAKQISDDEVKSEIKFHNTITDQKAIGYFKSLYISAKDDKSKILYEENMILFISYLLKNFAYNNFPKKDVSYSLNRAIDYIHEYFLEEITLDKLSFESKISKYHLIKLFKNKTGFTPHQYIMILKIEHAVKLINMGENLSQVAFMCGFSDQSHFIKTYKKYFGYTPSKIYK